MAKIRIIDFIEHANYTYHYFLIGVAYDGKRYYFVVKKELDYFLPCLKSEFDLKMKCIVDKQIESGASTPKTEVLLKFKDYFIDGLNSTYKYKLISNDWLDYAYVYISNFDYSFYKKHLTIDDYNLDISHKLGRKGIVFKNLYNKHY